MSRVHWLAVTLVFSLSILSGCRGHGSGASSLTADIATGTTVRGVPSLSGKLYVKGNRLRADWGQMTDVFDLKRRKGWRILAGTKFYEELGSKDLSTYAPEMTDGSICPHAQVPSACELVGHEFIEGRPATKWDVYNPKGFHVYFWTDNALGVTLRMSMGDAAHYQATNLRNDTVPDSLFELPAGYEKADSPHRP